MTSMKHRWLHLLHSLTNGKSSASRGRRPDWLVIDQEYAPIGPENLHAMIAATAGTACSPWVRVSRRNEAFVKQ